MSQIDKGSQLVFSLTALLGLLSRTLLFFVVLIVKVIFVVILLITRATFLGLACGLLGLSRTFFFLLVLFIF
jgi:hypothetical protein